MAKALAPGILCDEATQRRTAGELVFQRLDPIKIEGVGHLSGNFRAAAPASFGVHRGTELTLDTGKKLQSMPMQITNDPSIVSKVNVVVFVVPSSAHGQYYVAMWPLLLT